MTGPLILGVDPGKTGALAIIDHAGRIVAVHDMPDTGPHGIGAQLAPLIRDLRHSQHGGADIGAVVEAVHAMPKQGVTSSFNFGAGYGAILGGLGALGIPVALVTPAKWKRAMGLTADKNLSRELATRLWPAHSAMFARKKDDGRAEAALIAEHHRRTRSATQ